MDIYLYSTFEKRSNSTKRPSDNTVHSTFDCTLLDNTSILNPVIILENPLLSAVNLYSFTYAYIPTFNRYYYVTNINTNKNLWILTLSVDVLASFRHDIRNSDQYVLRSAIQWNQDIVDGIYPTISSDMISLGDGTSASNYDVSELTPLPSGDYEIHRRAGMISGAQWSTDRTYFKQGINSGGFIVGVVSDNGTGNTYYAMTRPSLVTFLNKILSLTPSDFTDTSSGVARALVNAIQYIASITWFPAIPTIPGGVNPVSSINIGGYPVNNLNGLGIYDISSNYIEEFYFELSLPNHPKRYTNTYGVLNWLNLSPYTQYNLYFAPFGNIPLDTTKLLYAGSVRVEWSIDFLTGSSILKLKRGDYDSQIFYTSSTNLGVSLPVSSLIVNDKLGFGLVTTYTALKSMEQSPSVTGISNWFEDLMNSNPITEKMLYRAQRGGDFPGIMDWLGFKETGGHDLGKAIDMGVDALASALGQVQTKGTTDSFLSYFELPILYAWFLDIAEPDKDRFGRPYNKKANLSTLTGGFVKCADSNVEFGKDGLLPTLPERNQVNRLLNTGVYLE